MSNVNLDSAGRPDKNWAGNIAFAAPDFYRPASVSELRAVIARARQVRVLATGHSFNDMADSPGAQVSLAGLPPEVEVDSANSLVRVAAGLSYAGLAPRLDASGFALRNMASLPHISVAGACATATHGSGAANQNLAAAITALEFVTADGDIAEFRRGDESFPGAVVHLGGLGVVTRLVLEVVPSFQVSQRVYENLPLEVLDDHFADIMASGYSVSLFTDWRAPRLTQVWIKQRTDDGTPAPPAPITAAPWFAAPPAPAARNPVPGLPPETCTQQLGVPGPWFERLPHFRPEFTPSAGDELQSEYLLPGRPGGARPARPEPDQRPPGPGAADLRGPDDRRRRSLAEPLLPAGQRGVPLHLDARHRRGAAGGDADRAAAGPVRRAAALGQDLYHVGGRPGPARRPPAGLP